MISALHILKESVSNKVDWVVHSRVKFASHDWPFLEPPGTSEAGSDLKITREAHIRE